MMLSWKTALLANIHLFTASWMLTHFSKNNVVAPPTENMLNLLKQVHHLKIPLGVREISHYLL